MTTPKFPKGTRMAATKISKGQILVTVTYPGYEAPYCVRDKGSAPCPHVMYIISPPLYSPGETYKNESLDCALMRIPTRYSPPLFIEIHQGRSYSRRYCSVYLYEVDQRQRI